MKSATILRRIARSLEKVPSGRGEPKYLSLHNSILTAIEEGEWQPGEKLPPETAFANEMPVSLGTVQKALQVLADEGVVERRHRDGTYVAGSAVKDEISILRFLGEKDEGLLPLYTNVLDIERTTEQGPWSRAMTGEEAFVRITRLVSVNLEFKCYNQVHLPTSRFGSFLNRNARELDGVAVTQLMAQEFNAPLLRTVQRLHFHLLPTMICKVIGVPDNTTGLRCDVLAYSYRDTPIAHHRNYLPPNDCLLELRDPLR